MDSGHKRAIVLIALASSSVQCITCDILFFFHSLTTLLWRAANHPENVARIVPFVLGSVAAAGTFCSTSRVSFTHATGIAQGAAVISMALDTLSWMFLDYYLYLQYLYAISWFTYEVTATVQAKWEKAFVFAVYAFVFAVHYVNMACYAIYVGGTLAIVVQTVSVVVLGLCAVGWIVVLLL